VRGWRWERSKQEKKREKERTGRTGEMNGMIVLRIRPYTRAN
jgi:hypothetical protein